MDSQWATVDMEIRSPLSVIAAGVEHLSRALGIWGIELGYKPIALYRHFSLESMEISIYFMVSSVEKDIRAYMGH